MAGVAGLAGCAGGSDDGDNSSTSSTTTDAYGGGDETTTSDKIPEVGGTFNDVIGQDLSTLNWVYNTEDTAGGVISLMLDGAYGFKPGQKQFPHWMELTSDDNKTWTAKLRENLKWSDPYGKMTAEDWVWAIKNLHQTDWSGSAASSNWYMNDKPIQVEKTGKYTFDVKLEEADPLFPKRPILWGAQMAPKKLLKPYVDDKDVEGLKKDKELNQFKFTGNLGPYKFETWERKKKVVVTRNEDYYLREVDGIKKQFSKAPYFDKYVVKIIQEPSSRLSALKTGEIDTTAVSPDKAAGFKKRDDTYLNLVPSPYIVKIAYNMRANGWKPFRKQGVRQALGCAVDKEALIQGVYRNFAKPAYTWQPKWSQFYDDSKVDKYGTGDLYGKKITQQKMKKALEGTDYSYKGDTLTDGNGDQVELSAYHSAGQVDEKNATEFVAQQFEKNAGIKVNVHGIPGAQFDKKYVQNSKPGGEKAYNGGSRDESTSDKAWDMSLVYGLNTYPMSPGSTEAFFPADGYFNYYGYASENYDIAGLFDKINSASTLEKRKKLYAELFGKLSKDQPMGMLAMPSDIVGYRKNVHGPIGNFFSGWDSATWYKGKD